MMLFKFGALIVVLTLVSTRTEGKIFSRMGHICDLDESFVIKKFQATGIK